MISYPICKIKIVLVILLYSFALFGCSADKGTDILTPMEREWLTRQDGKIIIDRAAENWVPIEGIDENGESFGIAIDYYRLIEKKLGFSFKIDTPRPWKERLNRFKTKKIDVVNNLQKNPERSEYLLFTRPFIEIPNVIIVRKEIGRELKPDQLKGMRISLAKDYAIHDFIDSNYEYLTINPVVDDMTALTDVSMHRADATIMNQAVASYLVDKMGIGNLRIAGNAGYINALSIASRDDWPILNRILEKGLSLITPEEREDIAKKWIRLDWEPFYKNKIFLIFLAVSILILLISFFWNGLLKKEINERRNAEAALRESESKFRNIIEASPMGIHLYELDPDGRLIFIGANKIADSILKVNNNQFVGMPIEDAFPPLVKTEVPENYRNVCKKGVTWVTEQIQYEDDKIKGAFQVHAFQTAPGRMAAIFYDITEAKKAALLLKDQESFYRSLFENNVSVMLLIDQETGAIVDANPSACTYYGYSKDVLKTMNITDINQLSKEEVFEEIERAKSEKRKYFNFSHRLSDGSMREVEVFSGPVTVKGRALLCSSINDISQRKIAEREREQLIHGLQNALSEVKTLQGFLPICSSCKKIRDDKGYWNQIEEYLNEHSELQFSHGICPVCEESLYGKEEWYQKKRKKQDK